MSGAALVQEIQLAHLRGRGGAGFPTGTKWSSVMLGEGGSRYAVCNAAEGEPGTFKDRALMRANPYAVLEGLLIAGHAVDAQACYIATKASFRREVTRLSGALEEMVDAGWVDRPVQIVTGPEEYLFGEETALLEVIEGNDPLPRLLPPYLHGLFARPQIGWDRADRRSRRAYPRTARIRRWSTTSRRWPTSRTSSYAVRSGSGRSVPSGRAARCAARSSAT